MSFGYGVTINVQSKDGGLEHGMAEPEGGGGEFIGDGGVCVGVVAGVCVERVRAQKGGEEFVVSNDLHLGTDHFSGGLVELFVVPTGISGGEFTRKAVVFAHEECVHCGQADLLVGADVTGDEE